MIVNHLRSLSGVDDPADGDRVRTKRRAQAEYLANLIQSRQAADPTERIVSVGDYNAFQFNDGYVDSIGTIKGTPTPANEVVLASGDLVNPDLMDLVDAVPASERYSFSFDGNAQELDHVLVTTGPQNRLTAIDLQYGRMDADFPEVYRNDPESPGAAVGSRSAGRVFLVGLAARVRDRGRRRVHIPAEPHHAGGRDYQRDRSGSGCRDADRDCHLSG